MWMFFSRLIQIWKQRLSALWIFLLKLIFIPRMVLNSTRSNVESSACLSVCVLFLFVDCERNAISMSKSVSSDDMMSDIFVLELT